MDGKSRPVGTGRGEHILKMSAAKFKTPKQVTEAFKEKTSALRQNISSVLQRSFTATKSSSETLNDSSPSFSQIFSSTVVTLNQSRMINFETPKLLGRLMRDDIRVIREEDISVRVQDELSLL